MRYNPHVSIALAYTLISVFIVSAISLIGVIGMALHRRFLRATLPLLVAVAAGALFGDALLHLLPEATHELGAQATGAWALAGIGTLLVLERGLHWHHHHACSADPDGCGHTVRPLGWLVLFSDGLHNVIDGMVIAGSFLVDPTLGIATTIAVALHEIPQEISDFALLVHSGFSYRRALAVNFLSALTAFLGAGLVFALSESVTAIVPIITAIAAGAFIYIAGSDLVPELHKNESGGTMLVHLSGLAAGIGLMAILLLMPMGHGPEQPEQHIEQAMHACATHIA